MSENPQDRPPERKTDLPSSGEVDRHIEDPDKTEINRPDKLTRRRRGQKKPPKKTEQLPPSQEKPPLADRFEILAQKGFQVFILKDQLRAEVLTQQMLENRGLLSHDGFSIECWMQNNAEHGYAEWHFQISSTKENMELFVYPHVYADLNWKNKNNYIIVPLIKDERGVVRGRVFCWKK